MDQDSERVQPRSWIDFTKLAYRIDQAIAFTQAALLTDDHL
jgi:hypothetical protein